jgi:hypothetical protein
VDWTSPVKTWLRRMLSSSMLSTPPRVRDANGRLVNLSAAVTLEESIADQVFKRTLFVAQQLSVLLILGAEFTEEHLKSLLPRERLMVLSSDQSVLLVDDARRSTSVVNLAKAHVIPPKTEMAVLVKAVREGLSFLKPLYVMGRLLCACNGVSCLSAPGECFLITIANFGDTVACMQPGTTVGVTTTNIEHVLLLDDDVDEKRDWRKEVPKYDVPESIRGQALAMLSKHASTWDGRIG